MTTYRARTPVYSGIQWTGSNLAEVSAFVQARHSAVVTFTVEEDQLLVGRAPWPFSLFVPVGSHAIYGPIYGADTTQASWGVKSADEVTTQLEPVP